MLQTVALLVSLCAKIGRVATGQLKRARFIRYFLGQNSQHVVECLVVVCVVRRSTDSD